MNISGNKVMRELAKLVRKGKDVLLLDPYAPIAGDCAVDQAFGNDPFYGCMADTGRSVSKLFPRLVGRSEVNSKHSCIACGKPVRGHPEAYSTPDDERVARALGITVEQLRSDREEEDRLAEQYTQQVGSDMVYEAEGQDRKSYTDTQDRKSYTTE